MNLVHFDVVETWATRESGSGRKLLLHRYPKKSGLRERLQSMPLEKLSMILKAGEDGDYFFVVTQDTPDFQRFMDWVDRFSIPQSPDEVAVLELDEPAQPTPLSEPPVKPKVASEPGEFTQMFRAPTAPTPSPAGPGPEVGQKAAAEPGEFTRMFKGPAVPPQRPVPPAPPTPPASGPEPGEFTRLFKSPKPEAGLALPEIPQRPERPQAEAKPPAPKADLNDRPGDQPGEFTQMFGRPNRSSPVQDPSPNPQSPPQKPAAGPGEMTRLFRPAVPPQRPAPPAGAQTSGDFTKLFNNPLPETPLAAKLEKPQAEVRPAAPFKESGDFTKIFGRPNQNSSDRNAPANLSAPAGRTGDLGAASGIFSKKSMFESGAPQPPMAAGPSEYTRLFQSGAGTPGSAPAQAEQKPAAAAPAAAKKTPQSIPLALIIILAAIVVVAIALILYFVLKR